jgi:ribosome-binding factor A
MDSRRQLKIASLIKEEFTGILSRQGKSIYGKAFVTVTNVTVTSDLTLARFYLSIFNAENPDEVIHSFREHKAEIKRQLGDKLRHHLRRIPEIEFFRDETLDNAYRIEEVFKKIKDEKAAFEKEQAEKAAAPSITEGETIGIKAAAKKKAPAKKAATKKAAPKKKAKE